MTSDPPLRALIVEDDRGMRGSLQDLLEAAGWRAVALSRAERVEAALAEFDADVILSDIRMPGMSGLELLASLTPDAPPLVLISAHGDIRMAVDAMQAGAYSFVEKPYEPRRLLNILSHAADQSRMRAATNACVPGFCPYPGWTGCWSAQRLQSAICVAISWRSPIRPRRFCC